ncbi:MAG: hypothetical protein DMG59_04810 [Acidobacteria bacterium]|nr:MAG: hypothetical protein DMG59_04810 [Acidobacteriota bacterium]
MHMGLQDTHHIPRIVIHPSNANVVYVAAQGHLWGANEERGVFKTTDGGKTWTKVLYINPDTGVNDLVMDPMNPDTLYAAAYQRRRSPFGFNGGGPGSGIYRTTDGGATWKKLSNGLPKGEMGRIGLDVYRRDPKIVYALVESEESGLYRSDDKGETWVRMSNTNPRPMYFSQVRIDPNNDQRIWVAGVNMAYSEDGGKTFVTNRVTRIHVDFHAIWIDPANSDNMIVGCDGGIHFSRDAGRSWDSRQQIAIAQFYARSTCRSHTRCAAACRTTIHGAAPVRRRTFAASRTRIGTQLRAETASMRRSIRKSPGSFMRSRRTETWCAATCARTRRAAFVRAKKTIKCTGSVSSGTLRCCSPGTTARRSTMAEISFSNPLIRATTGSGFHPT